MDPLVISVTFADTTGCCGGASCFLTMPTILIDGTTTNYTNSTNASAAIAAQAVSCLLEVADNTVGTISASVASSALTVSDALTNPPNALSRVYLASINLNSAGNVKLDYSISTDSGTYSIHLTVYDSDGVTVEGSDMTTNTASGTLVVAVAGSGTFFALVNYSENPMGIPGTFFNNTTKLYSNVTASICTVRAAYDNGSGGTSYVVCV